MPIFKIATWNVNSIRVRLPQVLEWLGKNQPDVLAVQETKIIDADFPLEQIAAAGYQAVFSGQKTYNGMAIFSRISGTEVFKEIPGFDDHQRRIMGMTLGDVRIINLYVPNGQSVLSEKYQYKLDWLNSLTAHLQQELATHQKVIVLGDFNIAPQEEDVYNPLLFAGAVLFSEPERAAFAALLNIGLQDCFRQHPQAEQSYTWWDYRMGAFRRNLGLRIDHILASSALAACNKACYIDKSLRGGERPSDHALVVAEFDFSVYSSTMPDSP